MDDAVKQPPTPPLSVECAECGIVLDLSDDDAWEFCCDELDDPFERGYFLCKKCASKYSSGG